MRNGNSNLLYYFNALYALISCIYRKCKRIAFSHVRDFVHDTVQFQRQHAPCEKHPQSGFLRRYLKRSILQISSPHVYQPRNRVNVSGSLPGKRTTDKRAMVCGPIFFIQWDFHSGKGQRSYTNGGISPINSTWVFDICAHARNIR